MRERYFIVFYLANEGLKQNIGWVSVLNKDGTYINMKSISHKIAISINVDPKIVVITNIIELNESDYKDWNS